MAESTMLCPWCQQPVVVGSEGVLCIPAALMVKPAEAQHHGCAGGVLVSPYPGPHTASVWHSEARGWSWWCACAVKTPYYPDEAACRAAATEHQLSANALWRRAQQ